MATDNLEQRVEDLELEVARLKALLEKPDNWIDAITGSFHNDPNFDEIVRLGREFRKKHV